MNSIYIYHLLYNLCSFKKYRNQLGQTKSTSKNIIGLQIHPKSKINKYFFRITTISIEFNKYSNSIFKISKELIL